MSVSPTDSKLFNSLFGDPQLAFIFADEHFVQQCLQVGAALAIAQAILSLFPLQTARQIAQTAVGLAVDWQKLQVATEQAGFPIHRTGQSTA